MPWETKIQMITKKSWEGDNTPVFSAEFRAWCEESAPALYLTGIINRAAFRELVPTVTEYLWYKLSDNPIYFDGDEGTMMLFKLTWL